MAGPLGRRCNEFNWKMRVAVCTGNGQPFSRLNGKLASATNCGKNTHTGESFLWHNKAKASA